jgi:hypothetical protein
MMVACAMANRLGSCLAAIAAPGFIDQIQCSKELVEATHSNLNDPDRCAGHKADIDGIW